MDYAHLDSLMVRLSREREYMLNAMSPKEKEIRKVWVTQIEKEIECEKKFLLYTQGNNHEFMSDDELLKELEM